MSELLDLPRAPCETCGKLCHSPLKRRTICQVCYRRELGGRHRLPVRPRVFPSGACVYCGVPCRSVLCSRVVCRSCHRSRPSVACPRCARRTQQPDPQTSLCPTCVKMVARPVLACSRCGRVKRIYDLEGLCYVCCRSLILLAHMHEVKSVPVLCHICGQRRRRELLSEPICRTCLHARQRGPEECARCHQPRVIYNLRTHTCKQCYNDIRAPDSLRRYIDTYQTPYPANQRLFDLFVSTIDWSATDKVINRRARYFGRFLQATPLPTPLTWEAIDRTMPPLGDTNRNIPKQIRASLLALGHLLAARGELEPREDYLERRNALVVLQRSPKELLPLLERYFDWLWERNTVPANIRDHGEALSAFWTWAVARGVATPSAVQVEFLNDYLLTLYWQWRCDACQAVAPFDPARRESPATCPHCHALHTMEQTTRYAQNTVRGQRAKLYVFFEWAHANQLVLRNPVQRKTPAPAPTIRHYASDVIRPLCAYISDPTANPREALLLYLILFHGMSAWELCHAQIPIVANLAGGALTGIPLVEAYYVIVPRPAPSRGNRAPGRPSTRLEFPSAARPWLASLLERYERYRADQLQQRRNDYLFVTPLRHNIPISRSWINSLVAQATQRILGGACNPNTLRKTCALQLAERGGGAILCELGWNPMQAFVYMWAARVVVAPHPSARTARRAPRKALPSTTDAIVDQEAPRQPTERADESALPPIPATVAPTSTAPMAPTPFPAAPLPPTEAGTDSSASVTDL